MRLEDALHRFPAPAAARPRPMVQTLPAPARSPSVKILIIGCAVLVAGLLYYWFGGNDPIPSWIMLPANSQVLASRYVPPAEAAADLQSPIYYLKLKVPGDARNAIGLCMAGITGVLWEDSSPRSASTTDLWDRHSWPNWIRKDAHRVEDIHGGLVSISANAPVNMQIYAWPDSSGAIVEIINRSMPPTTDLEGISEPTD